MKCTAMVIALCLFSPIAYSASDHDIADHVQGRQNREADSKARQRENEALMQRRETLMQLKQKVDNRANSAEMREDAAYRMAVEILLHNGIAADGREPYKLKNTVDYNGSGEAREGADQVRERRGSVDIDGDFGVELRDRKD